MLVCTVVVTEDCAGPDVAVIANDRIADVSEVVRF